MTDMHVVEDFEFSFCKERADDAIEVLKNSRGGLDGYNIAQYIGQFSNCRGWDRLSSSVRTTQIDELNKLARDYTESSLKSALDYQVTNISKTVDVLKAFCDSNPDLIVSVKSNFFADVGMGFLNLVEGFWKGAESLLDGVLTAASLLVGWIPGVGDVLDAVIEFDIVGNTFDLLYEYHPAFKLIEKYSSWNHDDPSPAKLIKGAGTMIFYIAAAAATGGALAGAGVAGGAMTGLAGALGDGIITFVGTLGQNTEDALIADTTGELSAFKAGWQNVDDALIAGGIAFGAGWALDGLSNAAGKQMKNLFSKFGQRAGKEASGEIVERITSNGLQDAFASNSDNIFATVIKSDVDNAVMDIGGHTLASNTLEMTTEEFAELAFKQGMSPEQLAQTMMNRGLNVTTEVLGTDVTGEIITKEVLGNGFVDATGNTVTNSIDNMLTGNVDNVVTGNADNVITGNADNVVTNNMDNAFSRNMDDIFVDGFDDSFTDAMTDGIDNSITNTSKNMNNSFRRNMDDIFVDGFDDSFTDGMTDAMTNNMDNALTKNMDNALTKNMDNALTRNMDDAFVDSLDDSFVDGVTDGMDDAVTKNMDNAVTKNNPGTDLIPYEPKLPANVVDDLAPPVKPNGGDLVPYKPGELIPAGAVDDIIPPVKPNVLPHAAAIVTGNVVNNELQPDPTLPPEDLDKVIPAATTPIPTQAPTPPPVAVTTAPPTSPPTTPTPTPTPKGPIETEPRVEHTTPPPPAITTPGPTGTTPQPTTPQPTTPQPTSPQDPTGTTPRPTSTPEPTGTTPQPTTTPEPTSTSSTIPVPTETIPTITTPPGDDDSLLSQVAGTKPGLEEIIDNTSGVNIPRSASPIKSSVNAKDNNMIPLMAGLGAAALAGLGTKVYLDRKENKDNEEELEAEEWDETEEEFEALENENYDLDLEESDYLTPNDEFAYQPDGVIAAVADDDEDEDDEEVYEAVNSSELSSMN